MAAGVKVLGMHNAQTLNTQCKSSACTAVQVWCGVDQKRNQFRDFIL